MKFAKFLLFLVVAAMAGIGWLAFRPTAQPVQNTQRSTVEAAKEGLRGDDPTYAEEVRKQAQLTQETQRKQQSLENELTAAKKGLEEENERLKVELTKVLESMNQMKGKLDDIAGQGAQEASSAMDAQMANLTQLTEALQAQIKAGEKRYEDLLAKINAPKAEGNAAGENDAAQTGENPPEKPRAKDIYGTGSLILPYSSAVHAGAESGATTGGNSAGNAPAAGNGDWMDAMQSAIRDVTGADRTQTTLQNTNPDNRQLPVMQVEQKTEWPTVFPVYTLPPNTVLTDSVLLTPMVGRVPIGRGSDVDDPFFFRVEVGRDNLAANGHQIPGVAKMIVSGYAVGIREQQCARGYIDSLTFIFADGRIVNKGKASGEGTSTSEALGYLSDPWGKPCIRGQYINNAGDYLKSRSMAAFLEAAAEGLAQGQVSYRQNSEGNYQAVLDGNVWNFVFGKGVSGSAAEIADYVRERTANAFDVVYVRQGVPVQIMLDAQVEIDYDANARKVNYYREPKKAGRYD